MALHATALAVVVVLCWLLGSSLRGPRTSATRAFDAWLAFLVGATCLYAWLLALTWAGMPWTTGAVLGPLATAAVVLAVGRRSRERRSTATASAAPASLGWGDVTALGLLGLLALGLGTACWTMSDFIFHWGFKAHRFWLDQGIDFARLTAPQNVPRHPDYPNLVPGLFVATSHARGAFGAVPLVAWSLVFVAGAVAAAREAWRRGGADPRIVQPALVFVAATLTSMTVVYRLGGSPDLLLSALMVSAVAVLVATPTSRGDLSVGWLAAAALGTKVEGMVLALALIALHLARRARSAGSLSFRNVAITLAPALLVAVPWWLLVARHGLAAESRAGGFAFARLDDIARALIGQANDRAWHGVTWLLLLLPLAWWGRRTRTAATVIAVQLAFYLWVYAVTPFDAVELVRTSAVRLVLHLWPAAMVVIVIDLDRRLSAPGHGSTESRHPSHTAGTIAP